MLDVSALPPPIISARTSLLDKTEAVLDKTADTIPTPLINASIASKVTDKKDDDAPVPVEFWLKWLNHGLSSKLSMSEWVTNITVIQERFLLLRWRRNVTKSFWACLRKRESKPRVACNQSWVEFVNGRYHWRKKGRYLYRSDLASWKKQAEDIAAARDCIERACGCSWWEWKDGSRPFFWRWPKHCWISSRDGRSNFLREKLPESRDFQRAPDPTMFDKVKRKLRKARARGYLRMSNSVKSLTHFFPVPKTWKKVEGKRIADDIRMVYDATRSGLNDAVWAPWFPMPTVVSHLRAVEKNTFMADCDVGEMFLNFMLEPKLRPFAGVDLTCMFPEEIGKITSKVEACWERMLMGFAPSPYFVIKDLMELENMVRGNRKDPANVFCWEKVILNLPGMPSYDPTRPWVYKVRADKHIASDVFFYMDDGRLTSFSAFECWKAAKRVCQMMSFLGIQDACRKRTVPSRVPGEWAGTSVDTSGEIACVYVSQAKWDKTKEIIARIIDELGKGKGLDFVQLRRDRGFLIYVSRTYRSLVPYLKGIHQTLDSWREGRDEHGWKLSPQELYQLNQGEGDLDHTQYDKKAPVRVIAVPRLKSDLEAISFLLEGEAPTRAPVRVTKTGWVGYGMGDASGDGFGAALFVEGELLFRYGQWTTAVSEASSNYRELSNLLDTVEKYHQEGKLEGAEIFLLTDNLVAENAFYKGTSSSPTLFQLILRLRKIELEGNMKLHVIHVAGTRMIISGVDALSRGETSKGVMEGKNILSFFPFHESATSRSASLLGWINSWWPGGHSKRGKMGLTHLSPEGWFDQMFDEGNFLWTPPPAAASVAIEQLCRNYHLREGNLHIVCLPRLMTAMWRKQLAKVADLIVTLPFDEKVWSKTNFEPLILAFVFPFIRKKPWKLRGTERLVRSKRDLQEVWEKGDGLGSDILRKLLISAGSLG